MKKCVEEQEMRNYKEGGDKVQSKDKRMNLFVIKKQARLNFLCMRGLVSPLR